MLAIQRTEGCRVQVGGVLARRWYNQDAGCSQPDSQGLQQGPAVGPCPWASGVPSGSQHGWSSRTTLKTFVSCRRNVMFWKKVVSRADETPTFDEGLSGQNLVAQEKMTKTQAFLMFFLTSENIFDGKVPTMDATHKNQQICYAKWWLFIRKVQKLNTFAYFLVPTCARLLPWWIPLDRLSGTADYGQMNMYFPDSASDIYRLPPERSKTQTRRPSVQSELDNPNLNEH